MKYMFFLIDTILALNTHAFYQPSPFCVSGLLLRPVILIYTISTLHIPRDEN